MIESSTRKAVTLFNNGCDDLHLVDFSVKVYHDGSATPFAEIQLPAQTLGPGKQFTICKSGSDSYLNHNAMCGQRTDQLAFDGDDALALYKGDIKVETMGAVGAMWGDEVCFRQTASGGVANPSDWKTDGQWACTDIDSEDFDLASSSSAYFLFALQMPGAPASITAPFCAAPPPPVLDRTISFDLIVAGFPDVAGFDKEAQLAVREEFARRLSIHVDQVVITRVSGALAPLLSFSVALHTTTVASIPIQNTMVQIAVNTASQQIDIAASITDVMQQKGLNKHITFEVFNNVQLGPYAAPTPPPTPDPTSTLYTEHGSAFCPRGYVERKWVHEAENHTHTGAFTIDPVGPHGLSPTNGTAHNNCVKCPHGLTSDGGGARYCHAGYSTEWRVCSHIACELTNATRTCSHHNSSNPKIDLLADAHGDVAVPAVGSVSSQSKHCGTRENEDVPNQKRLLVFHHKEEMIGTMHKCSLDGTIWDPDHERKCKCMCKSQTRLAHD
jgi:hypothetical protein